MVKREQSRARVGDIKFTFLEEASKQIRNHCGIKKKSVFMTKVREFSFFFGAVCRKAHCKPRIWFLFK